MKQYIPQVDRKQRLEEKEEKILVLYRVNDKGEFPSTYTKAFIPSSVGLDLGWYLGYTPTIIDGFDMIIPDDEFIKGLELFGANNKDVKKYNKYGEFNEDFEKKPIEMTTDELEQQLSAKKKLIKMEIKRRNDKEISYLYTEYGRESDSWKYQYEEAVKYFIDKDEETPFLDTLLEYTQDTKDELVKKILEKDKEFRVKLAKLIGKKQFQNSEVDRIQSNEEAKSYIEKMKKEK